MTKKLIYVVALLGLLTNFVALGDDAVTMTITFVDNGVVTYNMADVDSIREVGGSLGTGVGMKIYLKATPGSGVTRASTDYLYSQIVSIETTGGGDLNVNRNSLSSYYNSAKYMYNLEWPHIKESNSNTWVVKSTTAKGVTFSLEWDNSKIANRYTCYQLHSGNNYKGDGVSRKDNFYEDTELSSSTRSKDSDFGVSSTGYTRGHLCPSGDRVATQEQNNQTFVLSNMQPQWELHNNGLWNNLEQKVKSWSTSGLCDTLYVVKAATIDNVTLNGTTSSGVYDFKCNNRLPVPKYFYMAILAYNKSSGTYHAIGLWTVHENVSVSNNKYGDYAISIDELERRTGMDFFCNLPDAIEDVVEASTDLSYWGLTTSN